jgi:phosphatidate phosphatase APP1
MASLRGTIASIGQSIGLLGERHVIIQPYRGCGTERRIYLKGRVLVENRVRPANASDGYLRNLLNSYRRFESDEIPYARVRARLGGDSCEAVADGEGFFEIDLTPAESLPADRLWHSVELELMVPATPAKGRATGHVLVPKPGARFGVISDIDDTVVQTNVAQRLKMARDIVLGNAYTRLPFPGVAAFYRALYAGASGEEQNPLLYVSSSPWNLYDSLSEFFTIHDIPVGPVLFLRDWSFRRPAGGHLSYKLEHIKRIMELFPELPFILIGDSGQEDPEIYREVVRSYPGRILASYIRNVSRSPARVAAIRALAEEVLADGSALVLGDDTMAAARHAAEQGWIAPSALETIAAEPAVSPQQSLPRTDSPAGAAAAQTIVVERSDADDK